MEFNPSGRSASRIIRRILEEKNPGENPPAFQRERERERERERNDPGRIG